MHTKTHKKTHKKLLLLLTLIVAGDVGAALGISISGNWTRSIDASDLTAGAGSDVTSQLESVAGVGSLDVSGTVSAGDNWRLDVHKTDSAWPSGVSLSARRTSNGSGPGSISGGTTYLQVINSARQFFDGSGDRTAIDIQLRVSGVSVAVTPGIYSTNLTYTIVDTQ